MPSSDDSPRLALLNVFEVVTEDGPRHLICFLDPVLAGARGIDERSVVGEFQPGPDRSFDPGSFVANPAFVAVLTRYMNDQLARTEAIQAEAARSPGGPLYLIDPRCPLAPDEEPSEDEVLGGFAVDESGGIVPGSFRYNGSHRWFHPESGVSGVLSDRRFYDWLHALPTPTEPTTPN